MRILLKVLLRVVVAFVLFIGLFLAFLTIVEYRFEDEETLIINNPIETKIVQGETISLMIFNIGFAGLGAEEDFFMDGGIKSRPDSIDVVNGYLQGVLGLLDQDGPHDFYLLQEVDVKSRRSYNTNQVEAISEYMGDNYSYSYAPNFKALLVPFPVSLTDYIGHVDSGLMTLSNYRVDDAKRIGFDSSFSWPISVVNLKRAMLVSYVPIENSDKLLVIVNLHLSAYDSDGSMREAEMKNLLDFMLLHHELGNYVVIGGDFNQTFPQAINVYPVKEVIPGEEPYIAYPIEADYLPEGYEFSVDITSPTCRLLHQPYERITEGVPNPINDMTTQYYIIDGFIVSNNLLVISVETIDHGFLYSDHNPVVLKFTIPIID